MDHLHLIIDYGVIGLLLLLSLVACAVAIERWLVFRATRVTDFADRRELELHLTSKLHLIATIGTTARAPPPATLFLCRPRSAARASERAWTICT